MQTASTEHSNESYRIEKITDIYKIPPQHIEEFLNDLRSSYKVIKPLYDRSKEFHPQSVIRFTPDGLGETIVHTSFLKTEA